jgi:hypothetical protein
MRLWIALSLFLPTLAHTLPARPLRYPVTPILRHFLPPSSLCRYVALSLLPLATPSRFTFYVSRKGGSRWLPVCRRWLPGGSPCARIGLPLVCRWFGRILPLPNRPSDLGIG